MTTLDALGVRVLDPSPAPGSPEWRRIMTASKVAAVVGLAPPDWATRYTIWHEMAEFAPPRPQNKNMSRGHYMEPCVRAWRADQAADEGIIVIPGDGMTLRDGWMGATPDGFALTKTKGMIGLEEYKSSVESGHWGKNGTDEIAPYYKPQVQWQMHVTGAQRCFLSVIFERFEFATYVIEYDAEYAAWLEDEARQFMDTLPGQPNEKKPGIDDAQSTYECIRRMHPDIDPDVKQEIPWELVQAFTAADRNKKQAEAEQRETKSRILDLMGNAKYGTVGPENVFRRQPSGKTVALYPVKAA